MKMLFKFLMLTLLLSSCNHSVKEVMSYKVAHKGALKNMMHQGDLSAKADLSDYADRQHLYALGAIENLKGEVQIFDGQPWNTMVSDGVLAFDKSFDKKASLLVYAIVEEWVTREIPDDVRTYEALEVFVAQAAEDFDIDTDQPFPFLLEGTPRSFDWHVINWKDGDTEHSHEKHIKSGLHGTEKDRGVQMLGFYSNAHHAIFTHHTTNMHIHVRTLDNTLAGHVDGLELGDDMILKLPIKK